MILMGHLKNDIECLDNTTSLLVDSTNFIKVSDDFSDKYIGSYLTLIIMIPNGYVVKKQNVGFS